MSRAFAPKHASIGLLALAFAAAGCAPADDVSHESVAEGPASSSENGLDSINGLNSFNGLDSINGFNSFNGLATLAGVSTTSGLMTNAAGRTLLSYIVRCALPADRSITKEDPSGTLYTFSGALGLAPGWEDAGATQEDKYWVSSCLMAHINTTGKHIPIYLVGLSPLGMGRNPSYPIQEGSFVGDLFTSPPVARYCGGRGYGSNVVSGRIGAAQTNQPYKILRRADTGSERCDDTCIRDESGDGYVSCSGVAGNVVTVWRQITSPPAISFETGTSGFTPDGGGAVTTLTRSSAKALHGNHSMLATFRTDANEVGRAELDDPPEIEPGKNMTVFVNVPSSVGWTYISAYVMDGPGKNWRYTSRGYNNEQVIPGEWNSIVVPVPADFSRSGSRIGVAIDGGRASAVLTVYIDAFWFDS